MTAEKADKASGPRTAADEIGGLTSERKSYDPDGILRSKSRIHRTWRYHFETFDRMAITEIEIEEKVNKLGTQGWELVAITTFGRPSHERWVFKRPHSSTR
jgi:hypothetical protein